MVQNPYISFFNWEKFTFASNDYWNYIALLFEYFKITDQMSLLKMLSEWNMSTWLIQDTIYNTMEEILQLKMRICFQSFVATLFYLRIPWTHFSNGIRFIMWNSSEEKTASKENARIVRYVITLIYFKIIIRICTESIQFLQNPYNFWKIYFRIIEIILPYYLNSLK